MTTADISADLVVLGYGKGGKTLAAALAKQGWRVVMVERSALMYGGTCINVGCVPTKAMIQHAEHLGPGVHRENYHQAVEFTQSLTATLRAKNLAMLETLDTATVLTGQARFVDPHTVEVRTTDGGVVTVSGRYVVIGTGSQAVIPDIPGLADAPNVVTSTELLVESDLPRRLVVLGGGYIGLEFAAMQAAYGSHVTVLERRPAILGGEDRDVAEAAREIMVAAGVDIVTSALVQHVESRSDGTTSVHYRIGGETDTVVADTILVALGREPVTAELALEHAGVETTPTGAVAVDEHLRTTQPHIFAIGDVSGGPQFTYVSLDDYRIVLDQLTGGGTRSTADRYAVPYTLFLTPPLSRVGLTERAATEAGTPIRTATMRVADMATVPRARIVEQSAGLMKVVVDADTDQVLGAALLSYDSHEVINLVALAMRHGITAAQLRDEIYTHPSMTEAFNQLLGAL
ncbi:FAD-dependent oxidoreductase [Mycobacterium sp. 236(2023)]|uniref:FAD-dependent oxidoreductase n=1 Tax=Mycobacterium sp. 236(2023) TaxID=3038163 RepID=UPI0024152172|nr:FAD-dependent oxidoreductase [Mycobacterium sp. 236(2023)]MDG4667364.1 FAD-dependent oxidoreductase [Mycobacterium sp. 236(2023)]